MQHVSIRTLYAYWDTIRNGRIAPRRFEVEPAKISGLLGETFIAECSGLLAFRFRLAGTRICEQFGRELRGVSFLSFWHNEDRNAIASMIRKIIDDGAVGHGTFTAETAGQRKAAFEFAMLPLIHTGSSINRMLGAIAAIEPPFWLGADPLVSFELTGLNLIWPGDRPASVALQANAVTEPARRKFRVVEGGLSREQRP